MANVIDPFLAQIYDGTTSVKDFERSFNMQAAVHNWDDAKQKAVFESYLSGKAKDVYDAIIQRQLCRMFLMV